MSELSKQRIIELERAEAKLQALEAGGVDNWEWYDESLKDYRKEELHNELMDALINDLQIAFGECAYEPSERGAGIAFTEDCYKSAVDVLKTAGVVFKEMLDN